jgi:chemotaxis signal transduction protein
VDVLTLEIGERVFAVEMSAVRQILPLGPITAVPGTPPSIVGAMNAAGRILPVLDLACLLAETPGRPARGVPAVAVTSAGYEAVLCAVRPQHPVGIEPRRVAAEERLYRVLETDRGVIALFDLPAVFAAVANEVDRMARRYRLASSSERVR